MKNRKRVIVAFLLVATLLLGVGYAALTDTLTVGGTAGVDFDDSKEAFDGDIYFSKVISGTGCTAVINADTDTGTITVNDGVLKEVGDEVIATYTIKSESDLDVSIPRPLVTNAADTSKITNLNPEYFEVTTSWAVDQTLPARGTIDITITVRLIKTAAADQDLTFNVALVANSI